MNYSFESPDAAEGEPHPHLLFAFDEIVAEINDDQGYPVILVSDVNRIKHQKVNVERFKDMILTDDPTLYSVFKLPLPVTKAFYDYFNKDIYMQEGKENADAYAYAYAQQTIEGIDDIDDPFLGLLPNVPIITNEREIAYNAEIAKRSKLTAMVEEFVPTQPPAQIPFLPVIPCYYPMAYVQNNQSLSAMEALNYRVDQSEPHRANDKIEPYDEWGNAEPVRFEAFERQVLVRTAMKIKISNLASTVTKETLSSLFGPYGDIKEVQIIQAQNQQNTADAFVIYKIKHAAHRAQRSLDRLNVSGRQIKVILFK
eukprot:90973_1